MSATLADIGQIPDVVDPARRERCRGDLFEFLITYFPQSTGLSPFSDDHRRVIARIQSCILEGGRFVNAVYRGFAKTTISENSSIWAVLFGHRKFVAVFGADAPSAERIIGSLKMEFATNELLLEDFPEITYAIAKLENKPQRCKSQTFEGNPTFIEWTASTIVLPMIPGAAGAGSILTCHGITGASRGLKHKRADGSQLRPDLVILDDPQTDESASTTLQVGKRLDVIRKSILKLGGHRGSIAVVMNATVIRPDDVVDQLLDSKRNPSWQGERIAMIRTWSKVHETLWLDEYARIRNTYDADTPGDQKRAHKAATEFYASHRAEMDEGCLVSWAECYDKDAELSAIQHAYNALIDDGADVFASEFQNRPAAKEAASDLRIASPSEIAKRVSGLPRGVVPLNTSKIVAYIDVQASLLYYAVAAVTENFTATIIDYGSWPDQKRSHFIMREATKTLQKATGATSVPGAVRAGLDRLTTDLFGREWKREDEVPLRLNFMLIDSGFETAQIYEFCRRSPHAGAMLPAKGVGLSAANKPIVEYQRKRGERIGNHWMLTMAGNRLNRYILIDVNYFKAFVHERFATPIGDAGAWTLFGKPGDDHRMFSEHMHAETATKTEGRGRVVYEFKIKPSRPDNHLGDCVTGCAAAASILGANLLARTAAATAANKPAVKAGARPVAPRRRVSYL